MKKLILVLAMALMVSPAFAALSVYLESAGNGLVDLKYSGADTANLPRAFALTLTINGTGVFTGISNYKTGESTSASKGYGIYPATIQIDGSGNVTNYGTPQAAVGDPGAGPALPANILVLEFGSLYYGDVNAPATSGTLCRIAYTKGTATQIVMEDEDTYRGGLVLEDGTQGEVSQTLTLAEPECMKNTAAGYNNWVAAGKPDCWCYQYQGLGDIDGKDQGSGMTLKRIGSVDLGLFTPAYGKKRSQLTGNLICADIDHLDQGSGMTLKACGSVDLAIFATWYGKKTTQLPNPVPYAGDYNFWKVAP